MDSLTSMWENLSLSELEGKKFNLEPDTTSKQESILVARFLTCQPINLEAVARTFRPLWRTNKGFRLKDMDDNVVTIYFQDEADLERVIANGPWSYDKYFIIFQRTKEETQISALTFDTIDLWVQIHGLLPRHLNAGTSKQIGTTLSKVIPTVDSEDEASWGDFVRVHVSVNNSRPLCRGRKVGLGSGKEVLISFQYEKLANFCYRCGLVTHSDKDCSIWLRSKGSLNSDQQQFRAWMRAQVRAPHRRKTVSVEGALFCSRHSDTTPSDQPIPPPRGDKGRKAANGKDLSTVQHMESLSIDPRIPPIILIEERNQSNGERIFENHTNPGQHEVRKENIDYENFLKQNSTQGNVYVPTTPTSLPREVLSDVTNQENGPVPNGPTQKSWKRKPNNSSKTPLGPTKSLPQKRNGDEENWASGADIRNKKQAVNVEHESQDFLAVPGFQHHQFQ
jgi:hypothetical protein